MGDTIPRQVSLGCIRKLTEHEAVVEPEVPFLHGLGPCSDFPQDGLWRDVCKLKQILFFPSCVWSACYHSNGIKLEQRVKRKRPINGPFGPSSRLLVFSCLVFLNSPLLSPSTLLSRKADNPHHLCLPMLTVFFPWPLLPPYAIKSGATLDPNGQVALTPLLMQYIKAVLSGIFLFG